MIYSKFIRTHGSLEHEKWSESQIRISIHVDFRAVCILGKYGKVIKVTIEDIRKPFQNYEFSILVEKAIDKLDSSFDLVIDL